MDRSRNLADRLVEGCAISAADRDFIDDVVARAMRDHHDDAAATLGAFGGEAHVQQAFMGSVVLTESGDVSVPPAGVPWLQEDSEDLPAVQEEAGRYTLVGEHSHGGMGRILLVHDEHLGREIALKELLPKHTSADGADEQTPVRLAMPVIARFLQEARVTGQLEHPSIVPVYELGRRADGTLYYTMKFVRGRSLDRALREADSMETRLALLPHFVDLCQAIAYAHSRGVIHRDIKPANVMVGEFGETVVIDWGLAKLRGWEDLHADMSAETVRALKPNEHVGAAATDVGVVMGTPQYMPPEQAKGQHAHVDERSDVYSLGAVLYEMLTGARLFEGDSPQEVIDRVIDFAPKPIRELEPKAPRELVAICDRALEKEQKDRFQSAKELAEEVTRFTQGQIVRTYRYGAGEHVQRFIARHQALFVTALLVLVTAYGLFSLTSLFLTRQDLKMDAGRVLRSAEEELAMALLLGDEDRAARIAESLAEEDGVLGVRVIGPSQAVLAEMGAVSAFGLAMPASLEGSDCRFAAEGLLATGPVELQGTNYGTVCLLFEKAQVVSRSRISLVTFVGLGALLVLLGAWTAIRKSTQRARQRRFE